MGDIKIHILQDIIQDLLSSIYPAINGDLKMSQRSSKTGIASSTPSDGLTSW